MYLPHPRALSTFHLWKTKSIYKPVENGGLICINAWNILTTNQTALLQQFLSNIERKYSLLKLTFVLQYMIINVNDL